MATSAVLPRDREREVALVTLRLATAGILMKSVLFRDDILADY